MAFFFQMKKPEHVKAMKSERSDHLLPLNKLITRL